MRAILIASSLLFSTACGGETDGRGSGDSNAQVSSSSPTAEDPYSEELAELTRQMNEMMFDENADLGKKMEITERIAELTARRDRHLRGEDDSEDRQYEGVRFGNATLEFPEDGQIVLLHRKLTNNTPDFQSWVRKSDAYRRTDEFERIEAEPKMVADLEAIYEEVGDVGNIIVQTQTSLSEYDGDVGAFYLTQITPDLAYRFSAHGESVYLKALNSADARVWKLSVDEARSVREKVRGGRKTIANISFKLESIASGLDLISGQPTILATITRIDLYESTYGLDGSGVGRQIGSVIPVSD